MPRRYITTQDYNAILQRNITTQEQRDIIERAKGRCEYCQSRMDYSAQPFVFEHITPFNQVGETALTNLALACGGCNVHKYTKTTGRDPISTEIAPLYNPRQQQWHIHFSWSDDYLQIVGLTPTGRATVVALQMNRPGVINIRRLLRMAGQHPPTAED